MEMYRFEINNMEKSLLEHAIQYCIDNQNPMGAITPNMARDLAQLSNKIKREGLVQLTELTRKERLRYINENRQ